MPKINRLTSQVQEQLSQKQCGTDTEDIQLKHWPEFVADLWHQKLPHLRSNSQIEYAYGDTDPHVGRYGFPGKSEEELSRGAGINGGGEETWTHSLINDPLKKPDVKSTEDGDEEAGRGTENGGEDVESSDEDTKPKSE